MKFGEFIKEKILLIFLVLFVIVSSEILLLPYTQIGIFTRIYIAICPIIIIGIDITIEYRKKKNFYNELKSNLDELGDKYLILEIIKHLYSHNLSGLKIPSHVMSTSCLRQ